MTDGLPLSLYAQGDWQWLDDSFLFIFGLLGLRSDAVDRLHPGLQYFWRVFATT